MKAPLRHISLPPFFSFGRKFSTPLGETYSDEPRSDAAKVMLWLGAAFLAIHLGILAAALISSSRESKDSNTATCTLDGQQSQGATGGKASHQ